MLQAHPWLAVVPPLVVILVSIVWKRIFLALFLGLWLGATLLAGGDPVRGIFGCIERCLDVFKDGDLAKVVFFCCFIGAVMALIQRSGGVRGFIEFLSRRKLVKSRRQAQFLTVAIGAVIPIESSINVLIPGSISRPLYDEFRISREKLAFLSLSFCAPICTMVPINAWGAYVSGIMAGQGIPSPFSLYLRAIPFNLYSIFAMGFAVILIACQKDFLAMAKAERRAREGGSAASASAGASALSGEGLTLDPKEGVRPRAGRMLVPVAAMVAAMIGGMLITGHGDFTEGQGATAVFYAVLLAVLVAAVQYRLAGVLSFGETSTLFFKAVGGMAGMGFLITMSFAISTLCLDLKTGPFVAGAARHIIDLKVVPAVLFALTAFISFAIGTAWGSWAIMLPIGLAFAPGAGLRTLIVLGAMMSGGVFGNHCSPIADTTLMATLASGGNHIENIRAILPYALLIAAFTGAVYLGLGVILF
ncbi:MAG TPA: Na+/H+ antiporter NhaC family protein [Candidatus Aminicenantes bacterium]|nr:Na+/H+ antiporter NhaC family protein [Candidatus Aminicenantes bacterium]HRY65848.1 Na+/H+ antiporter NhaC family protein [Candidatus Aminicenantes bacterium]HRZ72826.1 Na+/H+ antiporter NhaC family protein [Candidatus Aminicenantes bacterium]